jgi:hypothetical protein
MGAPEVFVLKELDTNISLLSRCGMLSKRLPRSSPKLVRSLGQDSPTNSLRTQRSGIARCIAVTKASAFVRITEATAGNPDMVAVSGWRLLRIRVL